MYKDELYNSQKTVDNEIKKCLTCPADERKLPLFRNLLTRRPWEGR